MARREGMDGQATGNTGSMPAVYCTCHRTASVGPDAWPVQLVREADHAAWHAEQAGHEYGHWHWHWHWHGADHVLQREPTVLTLKDQCGVTELPWVDQPGRVFD